MSIDQEGRLICKSGDILGQKYRVIKDCNFGTFSNVYTCSDTKNQHQVVVKCYRSQNYFSQSAEREIKIMRVLNKLDLDQSLFVPYLGSFYYHGHLCIVLEKYGQSLYEAFSARKFTPLNSMAIRSILLKCGNALKILHHSGIIHTDLKLENILLPNNFNPDRDFDISPPSSPPSSCGSGSEEIGFGIDLNESQPLKTSIDARLIDFGSFAKGSQWHRSLATTVEYRAPEILMGLQWGTECDIWSLGCILVELALGKIKFAANDDIEHLFLIQHMISPLTQSMCDRTTNEKLQKSLCGYLINPSTFDNETKERLLKMPTLSELLSFDDDLNDLAHKMLNPDPSQRISIDEVLEHRFFKCY